MELARLLRRIQLRKMIWKFNYAQCPLTSLEKGTVKVSGRAKTRSSFIKKGSTQTMRQKVEPFFLVFIPDPLPFENKLNRKKGIVVLDRLNFALTSTAGNSIFSMQRYVVMFTLWQRLHHFEISFQWRDNRQQIATTDTCIPFAANKKK